VRDGGHQRAKLWPSAVAPVSFSWNTFSYPEALRWASWLGPVIN
jgi:hypothetical protein